jgi:hypothetical protein
MKSLIASAFCLAFPGAAPAEFDARFKQEIEKWAKVINSAKLAPD